LEKVFRTVGETALKVSSRRLEPLPKVRIWWVSICSFGRWGSSTGADGCRWGNMGSEAMMEAGGSCAELCPYDCGMEGDIVESIMRRGP
jgi:hypothetical protein